MRRAIIAGLAAGALLAPGHTVAAGYVSGAELLRKCAGAPGYDQSVCLGYVAGVADLMDDGRPVARQRACVPDEVVVGQLRNAVRAWLSERQDRLETPASGLVAQALAETYPCPPAARPR